MRRMLVVGVLMLSCVPSISQEGKVCTLSTSEHGCPSGLVCNPFSATCEVAPGCALRPAPKSCAGKDYYLSDSGSDLHSGQDSASPRLTSSGLVLGAGDRIHLLGLIYGVRSLSLDAGSKGSLECPIIVSGAPGGTTLSKPLLLTNVAHVVVTGLTVRASDYDTGVVLDTASDVRLVALTLEDTDGGKHPGQTATLDVRLRGCVGCSITSTRFQSTGQSLSADAASSGLLLRGDTFNACGAGTWCATPTARTFAVELHGSESVVEYSVFGSNSGAALAGGISFESPGLVRRNRFKNILVGGYLAVRGADAVLSNDFLGDTAGPAWAAAGAVRAFRDNIVSTLAQARTDAATSADDYNLYFQVAAPYASAGLAPHDVLGPPQLDGSDVPGEGSMALGRADPALPVPPSDFARADIGAVQHGASALPDGSYCLP